MELVQAGRTRVLFVMAAEAEYGPRLRALFVPLMTGVGPVEAGVATGRALSRLELGGQRPDLVVSLGSAGSNRLAQTTVAQVAAVSYRDMDASALGFEKGHTPFSGLPPELPLLAPLDLPRVRLSTGGNVVSGAGYGGIDADMVDMETYAVARACMAHDLPLIGLRGVSDGAEELEHLGSWTEYLGVIDEKLAAIVTDLLGDLASGRLLG